jgi:hypothetical protein
MQNNIAINENASERQTDKFDYTVETVRLHTPDGAETQFFGNRRTDTGAVLGAVTDRYETIQNEQLFATAESLFSEKGLSNFQRKAFVTHGGARARAVYNFPAVGVTLNRGDLILRLTVQNSFDGSLPASFKAGMFRLICSNGMATATSKAIGFTRKHTSAIQPDFIARSFDQAVAQFHNSVPLLQRMANTEVKQKDGERILNGLVNRKVVSERMAQGIKALWEAPTYEEDRERSLYNLYNAATQHLSHAVEVKRFELAERANENILGAFSRALRDGGVEGLMANSILQAA